MYQRLILIGEQPALVSVAQTGTARTPRLEVQVTAKRLLHSTRFEVTRSLKRLLGIEIPLDEFYSLSQREVQLRALAFQFRGLKPPRFPSVFEALINGICCQQLSLHVGILLLNRLAATYGLSEEVFGIRFHAFPRPEDLERAEVGKLRAIGFSRGKASYLLHVSQSICRGELDLESLERCDRETAMQRLMAIPGVGRWTAEYVLLRGLGRLDSFPGDDVGARNNLARWLRLDESLDYRRVRELLKRWEPYAGLIYFHLLLWRLEVEGLLPGDSSAGINVPPVAK